MKRFFNFALVLLTAAGLASCQRFEDEAILPDAYSVIVNTAETRTVNDGIYTKWAAGDKMTMLYQRNGGTLHTKEFTYSEDKKQFTASVSLTSGQSYKWYGVYPSSDDNTSTNSAYAQIPGTQTQDGNSSTAHLAGSGFPLWGRTDDYVPSGNTPVFTAHQVATVLKYVVTNTGETSVKVTKIQFSAPTAIAGACKADLTSENVVWQPRSSNTSQSVTLNVTNGSAIKNGENASFFVGAIPFSETGEYTVNVYATDGENNYVYTNKVNGNFVAESGKINTIPLIFVPGDPVAEKTYKKVTTAPTDWSGTYLIVKESANVAFAYNQENFKTPVTINNGTITTNDLEAYEVTVSKSSVSGKYDVKVSNGDYLYWYSNVMLQDTNIQSNDTYYTTFEGNGDVKMYSTRTNKQGRNPSVNYITYSNGAFTYNTTSTNTVQLYKLSEGDTPDVPPTPTTKYYELVTSEPASWDGTYLIVNAASGNAYAFDYSTAGTKNYASGKAVSISDGKIYSNATIDDCAVTVSKYGDSHGSEPAHAAYDIKVANGKYLYRYSDKIIQDSSEQGSGSSKRQNQHTLVYDNGVRMMFSGNKSGTTNNKYYFHYSSSQFTYESGKETDRVYFFRLVDGDQPEKQTQTLSFANPSVEWTLGDTYKVGSSYDAQSVIGAETTVTFTSSNASVATISDGKIKIVGAGTTNIIATAAENDTYKSGSASYTLTINPAQGQPTTKTYTKVSTITAGRNYVIAHSNNALQNNDGSAKAFSISGKVSNNTLTLTASDASSLEWKASASSSAKGEFKFANGGTYAYRESNTNVIKLSASAEEDRSAWTLSGTQLYNINSGGSKYYLNYSGTQWQATTGGSSAAITVYEENDGSTPDTPDTPTEKAYIKVTSAPSDWSGTYIIVDESAGMAFNENASSYASAVTISNQSVLWNETVAKYEVTISKSSVSGMYELKTVKGKYMYSYNDGGTTLNDSNKDSRSRTYYNSLSISGDNVTMYSTRGGDGSVNYFGYVNSTSDNPNQKNFGYKKDATTRTVQLYKLNGESTPSTPDTPSEPTPDGTTFNLENSTLKKYLDAAEQNYSNSTTESIMSSYLGSGNSRDLPNPVSLKWSGSATSVSIYEGNSTSGTPVKTMSFNSSTSADVYNLIPGKTYTYSTSNGQTGTFNTIGRRRMIKVSDEVSQNHARNCRDLGGVKTRNGETLNYGLMYRGTNMDDVGKPGYEAEKNILLNELGIKLDQDLRGSSNSPIGVAISGEKYDANTIQNQNGDNMKTTVSDVMNAVIKGDPVYIHCQIGSDRTGHMCMLYLALLGCNLKECDIDYEITSFASGIVYGTRTIGSGNEKSFRNKFVNSPNSEDTVPEAVENYVVNTLDISLDTVKKFRKAMGVSETLN